MAYAQVYVDKGKVELSVTPGEVIRDTITLSNTSDAAVKMTAYMEDFRYVPPYDGSKEFSPADTIDHSMGEWINFTPQEFTLPPFGRKEISFVITVPDSIEQGHYGVLFFEKDEPDAVDGKGVSIKTRVGTLFFLEPLSQVKRVVFNDVRLESNTVKGNLVNRGNVTTVIKGIYYILGPDGRVADRGELTNYYLPQAATGSVSLRVPAKLNPGVYNMVMTFDLEDGDVLVKEIDFKIASDGETMITDIRD